jgi:hypothetical protein
MKSMSDLRLSTTLGSPSLQIDGLGEALPGVNMLSLNNNLADKLAGALWRGR